MPWRRWRCAGCLQHRDHRADRRSQQPEQLADSLAAAEQGPLPKDLKARLDESPRMAGDRRRTLMPARLARQRPVRELGAMTDLESELAQVRERLLNCC